MRPTVRKGVADIYASRRDELTTHRITKKHADAVLIIQCSPSYLHQEKRSYARQTETGTLTNLPLWSRRPNHRARSTKMPLSQNYKRRCVACQHFPDDQTLRLQAGAGEDDVIHLPSGFDRVVCERQEEEEATGRPLTHRSAQPQQTMARPSSSDAVSLGG